MYEAGDIELTKPRLEPERCECGCSKNDHSINTGWCAGCAEAIERYYPTGGKDQCSEYRVRKPSWSSGISSAVPDESKPTAYLPHSCDEWVIGGRAEVEEMIADLQEILAKLPQD